MGRIVCWLSLDIPAVLRRSRIDAPATAAAVVDLDRRISTAVEKFGGVLVQPFQLESSALVLFSTVSPAVEAIFALQRDLVSQKWPARAALFVGEQADPDHVTGDILSIAEALRSQCEDGTIIADSSCVLLATEEPIVGGSWQSLSISDSTPHVLYRLIHDELPRAQPRPGGPLDNMPRQLTAFFGREEDIAAIIERFYLSRLVSIVGPGGIGKTRVAVQTAFELQDRQRDGTWWVDGRHASTTEAMADSLLRVLPEAREGETSSLERLIETLRKREALILLDHAEAALDATTAFVQAVGQSCPNVVFLVTSRRPLGADGETVYRLGTLSSLREGSPAERLFLDRISLHDPEFEPTPAQSRSIQVVCRALDGYPLALELAAAQFPARSLAQIERHIGDSILDLKSRRRTSGAATLNTVVEWGYDSLSPTDQAAFCALSVFPSWFNLEMAAVAVGDANVKESMARLVEASMIQTQREGFCWLLPLRAFARQRLKERSEESLVRQQVTDYCVRKVEALYEDSVPFGEWVTTCDSLYDLISEILDHLLRQPIRDDTAFRLVYGLYDYWFTQGRFTEGEALARRLLAKSTRRPPMEQVRLYNASGILRMQQGRHRDAAVDLENSLAIAHGLGQPLLESKLLANHALALCRIPRFAEARAAIARSCELSAESGDSVTHVRNLINRANIELAAGDCCTPWELLLQIRAHEPTGGDLESLNLTEAFLLILSERFAEAQGVLERQMPDYISKRDWRRTLISLNTLVPALAGQGLFRQAAAMSGMVHKFRERLIIWQPSLLVTAYADAVLATKQALGPDYDAEFTIGCEMSVEELGEFLSRRGTPLDERADDISER